MTKKEDTTARRRRFAANGLCPGCGRNVRDHQAPERNSPAWLKLTKHGIDPRTGHKVGCTE